MRMAKRLVIEDLVDPQYSDAHSYSPSEIRQMSPERLMEVYNAVFEPIDPGEPYTLFDDEYVSPYSRHGSEPTANDAFVDLLYIELQDESPTPIN